MPNKLGELMKTLGLTKSKKRPENAAPLDETFTARLEEESAREKLAASAPPGTTKKRKERKQMPGTERFAVPYERFENPPPHEEVQQLGQPTIPVQRQPKAPAAPTGNDLSRLTKLEEPGKTKKTSKAADTEAKPGPKMKRS